MDPLVAQHLNRLDQRRQYLGLRVEIKGRLGWENQHDREERDALTWALALIATVQQAEQETA